MIDARWEDRARGDAVNRLNVLDGRIEHMQEMAHLAMKERSPAIERFWNDKIDRATQESNQIAAAVEADGVQRCSSCGTWRYTQTYLDGAIENYSLCDLCRQYPMLRRK